MTSTNIYRTYWRSLLSITVLASFFCLSFSQPTLALSNVGAHSVRPKGTIISINQQENVPNLVITAVRQDLSRRTNIAADEFKVSKTSQETWPDGCLGLAKADEMCTQALVEGWRVTMSHGDRTWVYRTDGSGRVVRLEK